MNPIRILSITIALGLMVAVVGVGSVLAKQISKGDLGQLDASHAPAALIAPVDGEVEWAATDGEDITYIGASTMGTFFINASALETTKSGIADWDGLAGGQVVAGVIFNIADETVGGAAAGSFLLTATDYNSTTPASTPMNGIPSVTICVPSPAPCSGVTGVVSGSSADAGTFTMITAATSTASTTATFSYHIQDTWASGDVATQRAKVTSTSDPAGEFVTINEVAGIGATTTSATSQIFRGDIPLSSDAASQGTNDDGVWVQDGDTLTVTYLKSDGTTEDTDTVTVDGVKPTISAVSPADGTITNVLNPTLTFSVTDSGSGIKATDPASFITITIGGPATTTIDQTRPLFGTLVDGFSVLFGQSNTWFDAPVVGPRQSGGFGIVSGSAFTWEVVATDHAGNTATVTSALEIDTVKPTVASASTGISFDTATDTESTGVTTAVKVTFSEKIDPASVDTADFTVDDVAPSAAIVGSEAAGTENVVYLTVAAQASDGRPEIKVVGTVLDLATNAVDTTATTAETIATDGLNPTITNTISQALAIKDDEVKVTVSTDEKLAVDGLTLSVNGPTGSTGVGTITSTSPTTNVNEGTVTVASGTKTGAYGVSISATDLGAKSVDNLTDITDETVAATSITVGVGSSVITLANGPIGDANFDGYVDAADITTLTTSLGNATTSSITVVDASARTITVSVELDAGETASVSYSYVADDVFEVDQSSPTVSFDPVDESDIENQSPFIRVIFDEDEYPGDSFTTVTLTKAELTNPDLTTTDLLATFVSADNIEYIWAASNLALGVYMLTVSGEDTAGNTITDKVMDFTIKERAAFEVALRPGWNMVSLPGAPADPDINAVITTADVDVVLSYDPSVPGGWLTAVRDGNGNLAGTLTTISGATALWVHTSSFAPIEANIPGLGAGAATVPPSFKLVKGYNLVPVSTLDSDALAGDKRDADEYFTGLSWTRAYGYDNATNKFKTILPATAGTVSVGQGYWVFLSEAGQLVP